MCVLVDCLPLLIHQGCRHGCHWLQVRAAMVAAFGADATAKLGPLIAKWEEAVSAAGGVEALANQVRWGICVQFCWLAA